jgi:cellulose synthase/poly-beta-1,6-N-acetylglucosamine synthase-like glycosyltransferase
VAPADFIPALPWLVPFASLFRLADARPSLSDVPPAEGTLVSVIIPARNESATIETVVRSVLASRYRPLEVIVVDDRSTDDTAARVAHLAADDGRLRLLSGARFHRGGSGRPGPAPKGPGRRAAGCCSSPMPTPVTSPSCSGGQSQHSSESRWRWSPSRRISAA